MGPTDVITNGWTFCTYYYQVVRDGQNGSFSISSDGTNYATVASFTLPASIDDNQRIILANTCFTPGGSYDDWDYMKVVPK